MDSFENTSEDINIPQAVEPKQSFILKCLNYLTGMIFRPKLKVSMHQVSPPYASQAKITSITISNIGGVSAKLSEIGFVPLGVFDDNLYFKSPCDTTLLLKGDTSTHFLYADHILATVGSWEKLAFVYALDETGREHRLDIAPPLQLGWHHSIRRTSQLFSLTIFFINSFSRKVFKVLLPRFQLLVRSYFNRGISSKRH